MKLLTKEVDYALKTLTFMAVNREHLYSVAELSCKLNISLSYLRKILQKLNKEGILCSYKGKSGGFKMVQPPGDITLNDLVAIFQGDLNLNNCHNGDEHCPDMNSCVVRKNIKEIEEYANGKFNDITIKTLM